MVNRFSFHFKIICTSLIYYFIVYNKFFVILLHNDIQLDVKVYDTSDSIRPSYTGILPAYHHEQSLTHLSLTIHYKYDIFMSYK